MEPSEKIQRKLLIVDDEPHIVELMTEVLEHFKEPGTELQLTTCSNGYQACDKLFAERFDLVFLDFKMPGLNGGEVLREIRGKDGPNKKVHVVLVSGYSGAISEEDIPGGLDRVYFVDKPFRMEQIERVSKLFAGEDGE